VCLYKAEGALFNLKFNDELVALGFALSEQNVHVFEHIQHTAETVLGAVTKKKPDAEELEDMLSRSSA
jgi:hypothetical protein